MSRAGCDCRGVSERRGAPQDPTPPQLPWQGSASAQHAHGMAGSREPSRTSPRTFSSPFTARALKCCFPKARRVEMSGPGWNGGGAVGGGLWSGLGARSPHLCWPLPPREAPGLRCLHPPAAWRSPGWGPAPALGSRRCLLPTAGLLLLGTSGCPFPRPRWALPGPDHGPDEPMESKFRARPVSHGLWPLQPSANTVCGRAAREVKWFLSSRFFSNWRWPRGCLVAGSDPSVVPAHSVP